MAGTLFYLGVLFVLVGAIFGAAIDAMIYVPKGTGEAILKMGSAILGAGVFAVIMKSAQFSDLFQEHISNVLYNPAKAASAGVLIDRWRDITKAILSDVLPTTYEKAVDSIQSQFFNSELSYHFENFNTKYSIDIQPDGKSAKIKLTTKTNIILSPTSKDAKLFHAVDVEKGQNFNLDLLLINKKSIPVKGLYSPSAQDPQRYLLDFPIEQYAKTRSGDRIVEMERTLSWVQNIEVEPYIKGVISRYIKGCTVEVVLHGNKSLLFERFGIGGGLRCDNYAIGEGRRWVLADSDQLLLPGQGFIILLLSDKRS